MCNKQNSLLNNSCHFLEEKGFCGECLKETSPLLFLEVRESSSVFGGTEHLINFLTALKKNDMKNIALNSF
jgi:hypothetical protein